MTADNNARELVNSFSWFTGAPDLNKLEAEIMNLTTMHRAAGELLAAKWEQFAEEISTDSKEVT